MQHNTGYVGGAELQQMLIAQGLNKRNFKIFFIVLGDGKDQNKIEDIDGIKICKSIPLGLKINGILGYFFTFKKMWNSLKNVNADIYFQQCSDNLTGIIALFCLLHRKKFIYQIGSDEDVNGNFVKQMHFFKKRLYFFGLSVAKVIICQSEYQKQLLNKNHHKIGRIIKNPYPLKTIAIEKSKPPIILWVGSIKPMFKQPELFLDLAKKMPDISFQMIGGPSTDIEFYEQIKESAKKIPNLDFKGFIPYKDIDNYFAKASIFVNTSSVEGFPNVFLQAWNAYLPVISLNVDPDNIIKKFKLGLCSGTIDQMEKDITAFINNEELRIEYGNNGRNYIEREHEQNKIIEQFIKLIDEL